MSLEQKINDGIKEAAKAKDKIRLETMRSIRAAIIEFLKSGADAEMTEEVEQKILLQAAKKRKDAIEMYEKAGRTESADQEKQELAIIQEFLPKQLSEGEIKEIIQKIVTDTGASGMQDMGKVMGASMKELKGKADGKIVQNIVKEILGS